MKKRIGWCSFGIVLLVALLIGIAPGKSERVQADTKKQLYALEITTGVEGTDMDNIQSIIINYKEEGNPQNTRVYALFPKDVQKNRSTIVNEDEAQKATRDTLTAECGEKYNDADTQYKFLPYTTQSLFFYPHSKVGEVTSIKIITTNASSWDIQGMRLIKVDGTPKLQGNAAVPSQRQAVYSGSRLVEMKGTLSLSWSGSDIREIEVNKGAKDVHLETVSASEAAYESYSSRQDDYIIRMDIADEYMAGLESLATSSGGERNIHKMEASDLLYVTIYYEDIYGDVRAVKLPVISNVLAECSDQSGDIIGLAQQGDTLAFSAHLFGFQKLITEKTNADYGMDVTLGLEKVKSALPLSITSKERAVQAEKIQDSLSVTSLELYRKEAVTMRADISSGIVKFDFSAAGGETAVPDYYYVYKKKEGRSIEYGQTQKFLLADNTEKREKISLETQDVKDLYLVEIRTADIENAATVNDLQISFAYKTLSGLQNVSNQYSVKEMVASFYGYWPADGSDAQYFAYHEGTQKGGKLQFLISLADVDTFTSVNLSLGGADEWQTSGISISRVTKLEKRTVSFEPSGVRTLKWGARITTTDRTFDRNAEKSVLAYSEEQVLLRANKSKTIYFSESKSVVDDEDTSDAWDPSSGEMTYEQACSNLGFDKSRLSYDIDVTVAGTGASDSTNGDCGSKNLFYFRLNFEKGSSAYVLANQQLSADGFRTGQTERFSIGVNQDYGDLVSVDVIPDDVASSSDIYDKLNIAKIRVSKNGTHSLNRSWEISNPGWVGIDYVEEGKQQEDNGKTNKTGRYAGELAKSYAVDKTTYGVKLMFAISTAEYDGEDDIFNGSVSATLSYTDSSNEKQSVSFDMIGQMYSYAQITPETNNAGSELKAYKADSSFMFRGDTTDRFFLDLADVKSVDSMKLTAKDDSGALWHINNVGVSLVGEVGQLVLNSNNEYVYTGNTKELTTQDSENTPAYTVSCKAGSTSTLNIGFQPNEIDIQEDEDIASATITRKPGGENDALNVFVFPKSSQTSQMGNYDMKLAFRYVDVYGSQYANGVNTMQKGDTCYYVEGISARNFSQLKGVEVRASSSSGADGSLAGDRVIIQHVRSGVVIDTYQMDMDGTDLTDTQMGTAFSRITNNETQTVSLYFGKETQTETLDEEKKNVAVSIGFKSSLGDGAATYHSPYVFLTDEEYKCIQKDMIADVDFHVPYVKKITDIRVAGVGKMKAVLESAVTATYKNDTESQSGDMTKEENSSAAGTEEPATENSRQCTGWYSFKINKPVSVGMKQYEPDNSDPSEMGALSLVTLNLIPEEEQTPADLNLTLVLKYRKTGVEQVITEERTFKAGQTTQGFMLENVAGIMGMELKTADNNSNYALSAASVIWNDGEKIHTIYREVHMEISAKPYSISFVNADLHVRAESVLKDGADGITMNSDQDSNMSFGVTQGDLLKITADYSSSSDTDICSYELYRITGTDAKSKLPNEKEVLSVSGSGKETLNLTVHTGKLAGGSYELHISGKESEQTVVVKFTVTEIQKEESEQKDPATSDKNDGKTDADKTDHKKEDTTENTKETEE